MWLTIPDFNNEYYILLPTVICLLIGKIVMTLSPNPRNWSRLIIISIIIILNTRYILWRSLSTLNLSDSINTIFSLGLLTIEIVVLLSNSCQFLLNLKVKYRHQEAEQMSEAVLKSKYTPSVDILIPTFNEPIAILKRTIVGCQALDYDHKKIYILDDGQRKEMYELAKELECEYITRHNNKYAKAGNLNNGISQTSAELIVVFDADFVPTKNFLTRTVGFFQDQTIALVQTYQSFYNSDPVARNLSLENILPNEVESFSRYYQPLRDGLDTALCYGSSFLVRRNALEEIGGFVTDSLSEDYFTGVCLSAHGYRVIYLDESLSAGLSAENMAGHINQRLRWARGSLQAFFIKANPLTIPGLNFVQRIAHFEGLFQWFTSIFRLIFLLMPLSYLFLGVIPIQTTVSEWLYFYLPFYFTQLLTFAWLNHYSRSAIISDIYSLCQCFPVSLTVIKTLINPFSEGFKVTPKGISSNRYSFNLSLALPLIIVFIFTFLSFFQSLSFTFNHHFNSITNTNIKLQGGIHLIWVLSIYNLMIIAIALRIMLDVPKPDIYEWFNLQRAVKLTTTHDRILGIITKLSEVGAEIELQEAIDINETFTLEIIEEKLTLQAKITESDWTGKLLKITVKFEEVSLAEYRQLIEILFCRPGTWKHRHTPGELRSLWILIRLLFTPNQWMTKKFFSSL